MTSTTLSAKQRQARRSGTAQIEFLLVLPIFLILVLGSLEIGLLMVTRYVVMNAAHDGARVGIRPGSISTDVEYMVTSRLGKTISYKLSMKGVGRDIPSGTETQVSIEYRPQPLTRLFPFVPQSMSYSAVMFHE
jgi:Flp pilus assembly protein TadG